MALTSRSRRRLLAAAGAGVLTVAVAACGGGSLGGDDDGGGGGGDGGEGGGSIKVGLVIPQAGVYTPLGEDMQNGWELWLEQNDGTLGGYEVETVVADEGEGPDTGVPAVQRLLQQDQVDVVVGIVNSATALGAAEQFAEAQKVLVVANAGAGAITADAASPYVWRTSFTNAQIASAMGEHLAAEGVGPVYVMAPDYAAGQEVVAGFTEAYEAGGGTVAGQALTPFGTTQDFQPFLSGIQSSGAAATFVFYSGGEAVSFVQQYDSFGLKDTIPLYGSGFLTEGSVLEAQGQSAVGVQTTLHYSTEIENDANTEFVQAYQEAYDELPTVFAMTTFDTANVLDQALAEADDLSGDSVSAALEGLGEIANSPRGPWSFSGQSPEQAVYLREVTDDGGTLINSVVEELGVYAQPGA
ncbi:ABC transporter substrate-binding protein [Geodermatophilus sp. SYSU D00691]